MKKDLNYELRYIHSKNKYNNIISMPIIFLSMFILFTFICNDKYLGITEYFYFPLVSIILLFFYYLRNKLVFRIEHYSILFLIFYLLLNLVRYESSINTGVYFSYLIFLLTFLLITARKVNIREIKLLISSFILSALFMSIWVIILRQEINNWSESGRYTIKLINGVYVDPNFLGAYIVTPAIFTFNKIFINKRKREIYINIINTIIFIYAILLTGSRAAMLGLILGYSISLIFNIKLKNILLIIAITSLSIAILYNLLPKEILERMFLESYFDSSNITRLTNWELGIRCFMSNPIIGYGFIDTSAILINKFGYNHAIHNTYITFINQFGLIGSIPIIVLIVNIFIYFYQKRLSIFLAILVSLLFISTIIEQNMSISFWFTFILLYLIKLYKVNNSDIDIIRKIL